MKEDSFRVGTMTETGSAFGKGAPARKGSATGMKTLGARWRKDIRRPHSRQPASDYLAAVIDVQRFWAAGDRATDDTGAIQAAIDSAAAAGGGEVYLPSGTYLVSGRGNEAPAGPGGAGISIERAVGVIASGNVCIGNGGWGVRLSDSTECVAFGNVDGHRTGDGA